MIVVHVFSENDFEETFEFYSVEEARTFCDGLRFGADLYAGRVGAYLMPDDLSEMRQTEAPGEVKKALGE